MSGLAVRVSLLVVATGVGLALAELGARGAGLAPPTKSLALDAPDSAYRRSENPMLGFELKPGYRNDEANYFTSYPAINEHGQRDRERSIEKPAGVVRVLVLGDSVVEGSGVAALSDTLVGQLQARFGPGVEVLNFGVSGYCTRAAVELLETKGLAFGPDVVVLVFVENDFDNFNTLLMDVSVAEPPGALPRWLFHHSALFRAASLRLGWFGVTPRGDPFERMQRALGGQNVVDGVARLRDLAERWGFIPLIGVWPHFSEDVITDPHPMEDGSGDLVIERLARSAGIASFRFSDVLRAHRPSLGDVTPRAAYSVQSDTMHPTPLAARVVSGALAARIAEVLQAGLPTPTGVDAAAVALAREKGMRAPERFKVDVNMGTAFADRGEYARAIALFERALEGQMSPGWAALIHYNIGNAARLSGDLDRARAEYERAVALRPDQTPAKHRLAQLDAVQSEEVSNAPVAPQPE